MPESGSSANATRIQEIDMLDLLASLSERSLIVADQSGPNVRHRLLETVRQYGRDLLHAEGESEAIRNLHLDHFLFVATESEPKLKGREQLQTLALLADEGENLRAALEWGLQGGASEKSLLLAANLVVFWWRQGHFAEGTEWCLRACGSPYGQQRTVLRARVLNGAGLLSALQGDCLAAKEFFRESHDILVELGDREYLSEALCGIGFAAFFLDDYGSSREFLERAYAVAKEANDPWYTAWSGYMIGILNRIGGDFEAAMKSYEEAVAIYRKLGDRISASYPIYDIGLAEYYRGNMEPGRRYLAESLAIRRDTKDLWGVAESLFGLGLVCFMEGDLTAAKTNLIESLAVGKTIGDKTRVAISHHWLGCISLIEGDVDAATIHHGASFSIYHALQDRWGLAHSLAGYAELAAKNGEFGKAIRLWSASDKMRDDIGSPLPPVERSRRDRQVGDVRSDLSDATAFNQLWDEGRAMPYEELLPMPSLETD